MNTFSLKLIACDKVFYDGPCEILIFDGFDGEMAIMANHEPMTCSVETGELRFRIPGEDKWQEAIVSTGLLKVEHNKVDIIVYSAERPEEIDKFRAEAALERAREQLAQKQSIMEYHVSTALWRELWQDFVVLRIMMYRKLIYYNMYRACRAENVPVGGVCRY